jgi:hypothetical protein
VFGDLVAHIGYNLFKRVYRGYCTTNRSFVLVGNMQKIAFCLSTSTIKSVMLYSDMRCDLLNPTKHSENENESFGRP